MSLLAPGATHPERPAVGDDDGSGSEAAVVSPPDSGVVVRLWWGVIWFSIGAVLGSHALSDNSFLTHLATGRLIRTDGVPMVDPYSFLARGRPWVVQSWLASWAFATAEALVGLWGVRMLVVAATGLMCALLWRLSARVEALMPRLVITGIAVAYGASWWNERPQLFGFCCLAITLVVLDEERSPWWLVPVFAVWVNVHGSFPVGLALVVLWSAARWFGARGESGPGSDPEVADMRARRIALQPPGTALLGCALGGLVSPFGIEQLTFPLHLLGRQEVLRYIVEWRRPSLAEPSTWVFVAVVAVALWFVVRRRAWWMLPILVLVATLGASSERNIAIGAIVLVPVLAATVARFGSFGAARRAPLKRTLAIAVATVMAGAGLVVLSTPDLDLGPYPVRAVDWMHERGLVASPRVRVVSPDFVGNYLAFRFGAPANIYLDDRAEIFTAPEIRGYIDLLTAHRWSAVLSSLQADLVLWPTNLPLARRIASSSAWKIGYRDHGWIVACRADSLVDCATG